MALLACRLTVVAIGVVAFERKMSNRGRYAKGPASA